MSTEFTMCFFSEHTCVLSVISSLQNHTYHLNIAHCLCICLLTSVLKLTYLNVLFAYKLYWLQELKKKRATCSKYPEEIAITSILVEMEMCGDGGGWWGDVLVWEGGTAQRLFSPQSRHFALEHTI